MKLYINLLSILLIIFFFPDFSFAQYKIYENYFAKSFLENWSNNNQLIPHNSINKYNRSILKISGNEVLKSSPFSEFYTPSEDPNIITALGLFDKLLLGVNYSTLTGKDALNTKALTGFFCGLSLSARTAKAAEFMFEMAYSGEGTKQDYFLSEIKSYRLHNLQIGFLYKYGFYSEGTIILPNFLAGIFLSLKYPSDGELIILSKDINGNTVSRPFQEESASTWDAVVGFGLDLISYKNDTISKKFGIELRYKFGLETIASDDATPPIGIKKEDIILRGNTLSLNFIIYLRDPLF